MNAPQEPPPLPPPPPPESSWKRYFAPLAGVAFLLAKFGALLKSLPVLKFLPVILKSGGSMLLMIAVYTGLWGWKYAVGFVLLLLLHECGHLVAARKFGLNVGAPVFIPFMGALIALKDAPANAWIEAWVGIGGPILGALAALVCHSAGEMLDAPLLIALAWTGYWLNLFNLTPIGQLDGGRIVQALSPWLWLPGFAIMGWMAVTRGNFIIWLILATSIPRLISLFRRRTAEEERFYELAPGQRWQIGAAYFALIAALVFGMDVADTQLEHVHQRGTQVAVTR